MASLVRHTLALALCAWLTACGTDTGSSDQVTAPGPAVAAPTPVTVTQSSSAVSTLSSISLRLTDAPIDGLTSVVMRFTGVKLKRQSGGWVRFDLLTPVSVDLLQYQGSSTADLLLNVPAEADSYKEVRFFTDSDPNAHYVIETAGGMQPLQIPGGSGSGLKLKHDFVITPGQMASFVIDLDLRQSVRLPGASGNYQLIPVWRMIDVVAAGHITGYVDSTLLTAGSCSDGNVNTFNAVYVYSGLNVVPDDINQSSGGSVEPLLTTSISYAADADRYVYDAAFVPAGDYTVAFTCNANLENLDADDNLQFFGAYNATVLQSNTVFLR